MNIKEITRLMSSTFFVIFSGSVLAMYTYSLIFGIDTLKLHNITALLIMTVLADLAYFIFYSNRELSKRQMHMRSIIHFITIMGILLFTASYMEWILWSEPIQVIVFVGLVTSIYVVVRVISDYQSKKLADKLTQKLRERYKG